MHGAAGVVPALPRDALRRRGNVTLKVSSKSASGTTRGVGFIVPDDKICGLCDLLGDVARDSHDSDLKEVISSWVVELVRSSQVVATST